MISDMSLILACAQYFVINILSSIQELCLLSLICEWPYFILQEHNTHSVLHHHWLLAAEPPTEEAHPGLFNQTSW